MCVVFLSISEKNELVSQCGCEFVSVVRVVCVCVCLCYSARVILIFYYIEHFFVCIDNPRASVQNAASSRTSHRRPMFYRKVR